MFEQEKEKYRTELTGQPLHKSQYIFNDECIFNKKEKQTFIDRIMDGRFSQLLAISQKYHEAEKEGKIKGTIMDFSIILSELGFSVYRPFNFQPVFIPRTASLKSWLKHCEGAEQEDFPVSLKTDCRKGDSRRIGKIRHFFGCHRLFYLLNQKTPEDTHENFTDEIFHRCLMYLAETE